MRRRAGITGAVLLGAGIAGGLRWARPRLQRFAIAELSMAPALLPGDFVVARRAGAPRRGAVVVFEHPDRPGFFLVKRVVAVGPAIVEIAGGSLLVAGIPQREPWSSDVTGPPGVWQLEAGEIFVLGDRRGRSLADSRRLGPLDGSAAARVVLRYWPLSRIGRVS